MRHRPTRVADHWARSAVLLEGKCALQNRAHRTFRNLQSTNADGKGPSDPRIRAKPHRTWNFRMPTRVSSDSRLDALQIVVLPRMRGASERRAGKILGPAVVPGVHRGRKPRMTCPGGARRASPVGLLEARKGLAGMRMILVRDARHAGIIVTGSAGGGCSNRSTAVRCWSGDPSLQCTQPMAAHNTAPR